MEDQPAPILSLVSSCQGLEQFLLLAKTARGPAAAELVKQALEAPGVYAFEELLETECIKQLSEGPDSNYMKLLEIFAYGTYSDYKSMSVPLPFCRCLIFFFSNFSLYLGEADSLPTLSQAQLIKLKHLTIVSLASKCQVSEVLCF